MKNIKRVLGLILAASIIFSSFGIVTSSVSAQDLQTENIIADEKFEGTVNLAKWSIAAGMRTNIDNFGVVPEPGNETNNVMRLTYRGDVVKSGGSTIYQYDFTDIPSSGKLIVSYKIKIVDTSGVIINNYPMFFGISTSETGTGVVTPTATSLLNNPGTTASVATGAKADGTASSNINTGAGFGSTWSNISCIMDFNTKEVKYFREGNPILTSPIYLKGPLPTTTFDKGIRLKFMLRETTGWDGTKPDAYLYVDNISIKRVPSFTAEASAFDAVKANPIQPSYTFNFSNPVSSYTAFYNAVSIKKNGVAVALNKRVELSTDKKTGTVKFLDNLENNTDYTLELESTLTDTYGMTLGSTSSIPFKTKEINLINKEKVIVDDNFDNTATDLSKWSMPASTRMSIDSFAVVPDPADANNKVMRYRVNSSSRTAGSSVLSYAFTDIPNSGKFMISYRFKTGDITNPVSYAAYPSVFGLSVNDVATSTAYTGTNAINNLAATGRVAGQNNTTGGNVNTNTPIFGDSWSTIKCVVDFSTQGVLYYRDGSATALNASNPTYLNWLNNPAGNTTFNPNKYNKALAVRMNFPVPANWTAGDADFYFDDIVIKRVPALSVALENQATDVDAMKPLTLNLATPVTLDALQSAVNLKIGETPVPVNVTLSSDAKVATITPQSGSLAGNTTYTLDVANTLADVYGQTLPTTYTTTFTTGELLGYVNIKDTLVVNPTNGGVSVPLVNATQISAKVTVNNPTALSQDTVLVVAVYSNSRLLGVKTLEVNDIAPMSNSGEKEFVFTNVSGATQVKAFLWDDLTNICPLDEAQIAE